MVILCHLGRYMSMPLGRWASRPLTHDLSHRLLVLLEVQETRYNCLLFCLEVQLTKQNTSKSRVLSMHIPISTRDQSLGGPGLAFLLQTLGYRLSNVLYISIVETGNGDPRVVCHIDVILLCGPQSVSIRSSSILRRERTAQSKDDTGGQSQETKHPRLAN